MWEETSKYTTVTKNTITVGPYGENLNLLKRTRPILKYWQLEKLSIEITYQLGLQNVLIVNGRTV